MKKFLFIGETLNAFDFTMTAYLVFVTGCFVEANWLPGLLIGQFGFFGLVIDKVFAAGLIYLLYWLLKKRRKKRLSLSM